MAGQEGAIMSADIVRPARQRGFLGVVERVGNMLPDPTIIFLYLIVDKERSSLAMARFKASEAGDKLTI